MSVESALITSCMKIMITDSTPGDSDVLLEFRWSVTIDGDEVEDLFCSLYVDRKEVTSCSGGEDDLRAICLGEESRFSIMVLPREPSFSLAPIRAMVWGSNIRFMLSADDKLLFKVIHRYRSAQDGQQQPFARHGHPC